jgi:hypothetical protein
MLSVVHTTKELCAERSATGSTLASTKKSPYAVLAIRASLPQPLNFCRRGPGHPGLSVWIVEVDWRRVAGSANCSSEMAMQCTFRTQFPAHTEVLDVSRWGWYITLIFGPSFNFFVARHRRW